MKVILLGLLTVSAWAGIKDTRKPAGDLAWKSCQPEIDKYCKGASSEFAFQIASCLERHRNDLSKGCQKTLRHELREEQGLFQKSGE